VQARILPRAPEIFKFEQAVIDSYLAVTDFLNEV